MSGKVYAVASGKGGVGKTTTVVNLGVTLRADEHSVALVDADLGMANLGTFLGIDHEPTLHDVLADEASIEDALVEQVDGFGILRGTRDLRQYAAADPRRLESVLEELSERFDYVIVDTGAGVGFEDVLPLELVDEVLLVASPDRAALGDVGKTAEVSELLGVTVRGVVFTMVEEDDDVAAIADRMGVELLATVPEDPAVPESTASGRPLEAFAPDSAAAKGYRELAAALTGRSVAQYEPTGTGVDDAESNDSPLGASEGRSDGAGGDAESEPATSAERSEEADVTEAASEVSESAHRASDAPDEITGESADTTAEPADDEPVTESTEVSEEPAPATDETEAKNGSRAESDAESADDDSAPADAAEQAEGGAATDEGPADTEQESAGPESEDTGAESADDDGDEPEESGGLLSRLGGLFS